MSSQLSAKPLALLIYFPSSMRNQPAATGDERLSLVPCGTATLVPPFQSRVTSHGTRSSLSRYLVTALLPHLTQEALSMRDRTTKILRDRLAHIRQGVPHSQVNARSASRRIRQNRRVLPRMVRRRPSRIGIAPVVRGDHQHIRKAKQRQELPEQTVELFQRFGKSLNVFPVAV